MDRIGTEPTRWNSVVGLGSHPAPDSPLPMSIPDPPDRPPSTLPPAPRRLSSVGVWVKRFGVAGFLFFLVKGLLWLVVPALLVSFGVQCGIP